MNSLARPFLFAPFDNRLKQVKQSLFKLILWRNASVVGNIKTFDAIRNGMKKIDEHLMSLQSVDELELEKLESLRIILEILDGFYKNSDS